MADTIFQATRGINFIDDRQRDALLRQLIHDANLVETDPAVIRRKTNKGFRRLAEKIRDLWCASYHDAYAPDANMWYSGSHQTYWFGSGAVGQQWTHIRNHADQDWIIRNAWRMDVRYIDNPNPYY